MPFKDNKKDYMKTYMRNKRAIKFYKSLYGEVMNELTQRCILPRHIYDFRMIHKEMLKNVFKKKIIRRYEKTEVIAHSYMLVKPN